MLKTRLTLNQLENLWSIMEKRDGIQSGIQSRKTQ